MPRRIGCALPRHSAFTLIEMLVVLAIIGILAALGFTFFWSASRSAEQIAADANAVIEKLDSKPPPVLRGERPTPIPNQYLFVLRGDVADPQAEVQRLTGRSAAKTLHVYDGAFKGFAAQVSAESYAALCRDPAIVGVEQDQRVSIRAQEVPRGIQRLNTNLVYSGMAAGLAIPGSKQDLQQSGKPIWSNVNIAVLDTGIDDTHPELNVLFSRGFVGGNASDVADLHGHGTHVAGTIGAFNNTLGVVGVVPGARLYNLKVLNASGTGSYADILAALNYVRANASKIHVVNMSIGGPKSTLINAAVDSCVQAGVVVVVAAGNDGKPASGFSPASASKAIAVGALTDSDGLPGKLGTSTSYGQDDSFATFSNYGSLVKFVAPGVRISSTYPINKGGYAIFSGTSMATPHIAGLAARIQNAALDPTAPGASKYFPARPAGKRATPTETLNVLKQSATEKIPGRFDSLQYPLVNAKTY